MDAMHGVILQNDQQGGLIWARHQHFEISGPARKIEKIRIQGQDHYCIAINNNAPVFLRINKK
jgi:hypothetical protein